jgi:hypothetical protein
MRVKAFFESVETVRLAEAVAIIKAGPAEAA